jgi:hypothetical protein
VCLCGKIEALLLYLTTKWDGHGLVCHLAVIILSIRAAKIYQQLQVAVSFAIQTIGTPICYSHLSAAVSAINTAPNCDR